MAFSVTGQITVTDLRDGTPGAAGDRGATNRDFLVAPAGDVTAFPTTSAQVQAAFIVKLDPPVLGDRAFFYTGTISNKTKQEVWELTNITGNPAVYTWTKYEEYIDGDALISGSTVTGVSLKVGTITPTADARPASGAGMFVAGADNAGATGITAGDFIVGNTTQFIGWDTSEGVLTIQGKIRSLNEGVLSGQSVGGSPYVEVAKNATQSVFSLTNNLAGPGTYVFVMVGGGGGGFGQHQRNSEAAGRGGAGAGAAVFSFDWDGTTPLEFTRGVRGLGNSSSSNGVNGNGGTSNFKYGNTIIATANGGQSAAVNQLNPNGGNANFSNNFGNNFGPGFISSIARAGQGVSSNSFVVGNFALQGGGIDFFGDGLTPLGGFGGLGGNPYGYNYLVVTETGSEAIAVEDSRTVMGLPAGITGIGGSGFYNDTNARQSKRTYAVIGGQSVQANTVKTCAGADGGIFCGGGGAVSFFGNASNIRVYGGLGGIGGGGGGATALSNYSARIVGGHGGWGELFWSKL